MTVQQTSRPAVPFTPSPRTDFGSILSVAEVREGAASLDPADLIESYNCVSVQHVALDDCTDFAPGGFSKEFGSPAWSDGVRFVVQGGVRCKPFGFDPNDSRIRAAFEVQEANGVAEALRDTVLDDAQNLTPTAGAVTIPQALGILESAGYCAYAGYPVIHMGAALAAQLTAQSMLERAGSHLETKIGTPVAVSCGYETNTSGKVDPDQWAYVTGAVVLGRSNVAVVPELDRSTNEWTVLFERVYVAAVDCFAAKVQVQVL